MKPPAQDLREQRARIFKLINECLEINKDTLQKTHDCDIEVNIKSKVIESCFKTEQELLTLQEHWFNKP